MGNGLMFVEDNDYSLGELNDISLKSISDKNLKILNIGVPVVAAGLSLVAAGMLYTNVFAANDGDLSSLNSNNSQQTQVVNQKSLERNLTKQQYTPGTWCPDHDGLGGYSPVCITSIDNKAMVLKYNGEPFVESVDDYIGSVKKAIKEGSAPNGTSAITTAKNAKHYLEGKL